jgi:hypothetical protein
MITGKWMLFSSVDGHQSTSPRTVPTSNAGQLVGAIRHLMPRMRDREVPCGMKGGEQNGHEEESS